MTKKLLPALLLGLAGLSALTGCGSSPDSAPRGADATEADATTYRQGQALQQLRAQITPPLDEPLRLLDFAEPRYPSFLLSDNSPSARGNVTVSFEILPSGYVGAAKALPGPQNDALNQPAVDAIRHWRFAPIKRGGKPARLFLQQTFRMEP
ncbi:MAG: TonB family protein [Acidovorax sp.]